MLVLLIKIWFVTVRWTLEQFHRQCWWNFWGMGRSAYRLFHVHRYHLELIINFNIRKPEQCLTKQPRVTENDHQGDWSLCCWMLCSCDVFWVLTSFLCLWSLALPSNKILHAFLCNALNSFYKLCATYWLEVPFTSATYWLELVEVYSLSMPWMICGWTVNWRQAVFFVPGITVDDPIELVLRAIYRI